MRYLIQAFGILAVLLIPLVGCAPEYVSFWCGPNPCANKDCNDGNQCTVDRCYCDLFAGWQCTHDDVDDGTSCSVDGIAGVCVNGGCDLCAIVECQPPEFDQCTDQYCRRGVCVIWPAFDHTTCTFKGLFPGRCISGFCRKDLCEDCWVQQTSGTTESLSGVSFTDTLTGTVVGGYGTILRTTDGGETWVAQDSGTTEGLSGVSFADALIGTVVGSSGTILRTADGGDTWVSQNSGTAEYLFGVSFADALTGTVVGGYATILRTTDGGETWVAQDSGIPRIPWTDLHGVSFTDALTGTVVGDGGTILRTTDGGATWVAQNSGTGAGFQDPSFTDALTGTAVGDSGTILRTTDGGETWVAQSSDTTESIWLSGVSFVDANHGIAVGSDFGDGTILRTTDGGETWVTEHSGFDWSGPWLNDVSFTDANTATVVGDGGTILQPAEHWGGRGGAGGSSNVGEPP